MQSSNTVISNKPTTNKEFCLPGFVTDCTFLQFHLPEVVHWFFALSPSKKVRPKEVRPHSLTRLSFPVQYCTRSPQSFADIYSQLQSQEGKTLCLLQADFKLLCWKTALITIYQTDFTLYVLKPES